MDEKLRLENLIKREKELEQEVEDIEKAKAIFAHALDPTLNK